MDKTIEEKAKRESPEYRIFLGVLFFGFFLAHLLPFSMLTVFKTPYGIGSAYMFFATILSLFGSSYFFSKAFDGRIKLE